MSNESDDTEHRRSNAATSCPRRRCPSRRRWRRACCRARAPGVEVRRADKIRVGIIGAGGIVGSVHIPGLRRMPGVEIVAVANRSLESSRRAADEFDIPRAYADWEQLLGDKGIDAVLIGTWPYMHRDITLAALDSGRHVLCQARMANNTAEAREMLAASQRHANLVCQLVPTLGQLPNRPGAAEPARRRRRGRSAVRGSADAATRVRGLRRRARLAPRPGVQRLQRAERRRHVRIDDALARPRQPRDGHDARADTRPARRARRAARGDDTGSRRGALRARQRRAGAHEVQRDHRALARQRHLDLRQRRHDPRRQRAEHLRRAPRRPASSRRIRIRPRGRLAIASKKSSSTRFAASSRSR